MDNEFDLIKTYYEQSVTGFEREVRLLFERMNFFLASMAFIIAALATLLTNQTGLTGFLPIWSLFSVFFSDYFPCRQSSCAKNGTPASRLYLLL